MATNDFFCGINVSQHVRKTNIKSSGGKALFYHETFFFPNERKKEIE